MCCPDFANPLLTYLLQVLGWFSVAWLLCSGQLQCDTLTGMVGWVIFTFLVVFTSSFDDG